MRASQTPSIAGCSEIDPVSLLFEMAHLTGSVIVRVSF
jgi:hypothetical protein